MSLPVAILSGGLATRLGSVARNTPKSLIRLGPDPFAVHQLRLLKKNGLTRVVFCIGHMGNMIAEELGDGKDWGMNLEYSQDGPDLLGTGGALRKALPLLGETFLVMNGDSYLDCDYAAVLDSYRDSGKPGLMTVFCNKNRWDRSNILYEDGKILKYSKRCVEPEMQHIDYGLGILSAGFLGVYPEKTAFDLETVYQDLLARDQLAGYEVTERFYEIGSPDGLRETQDHLQKHSLTWGDLE